MSSSHGQKVTTDPESIYDPKNENPGIVASDSLAAESIQEGGSFGANSDSRGPMDQPARSLNANTTDTSNATRLDPAVSAEARAAQGEWSEAQQLNAGSSLGAGTGIGSSYNARVSDSTNRQGDAFADTSTDNFQPKGKNLQEGGFDSSAPNASFTTDIGGKRDPGRVALGKMEADNVPVAGVAGERQQEITGQGQFDSLDETSA